MRRLDFLDRVVYAFLNLDFGFQRCWSMAADLVKALKMWAMVSESLAGGQTRDGQAIRAQPSQSPGGVRDWPGVRA